MDGQAGGFCRDCTGSAGLFRDLRRLAGFVQAAYESSYPDCNWVNADINADGVVSYGDINPFVTLLSQP